MKSMFVAAAVIAAVPASAAFAEPSATARPAAEAAAPAKPGRGKIYCSNETISGSRMPVRVCKTRAEWAAEGVDTRDFDR